MVAIVYRANALAPMDIGDTTANSQLSLIIHALILCVSMVAIVYWVVVFASADILEITVKSLRINVLLIPLFV